uniref:Integrase zinc-binding domain-containing protein n=1 Tax=Ditylenchus dipsaci TaxID=166011 RepID=A0A915DZ81_9BILA
MVEHKTRHYHLIKKKKLNPIDPYSQHFHQFLHCGKWNPFIQRVPRKCSYTESIGRIWQRSDKRAARRDHEDHQTVNHYSETQAFIKLTEDVKPEVSVESVEQPGPSTSSSITIPAPVLEPPPVMYAPPAATKMDEATARARFLNDLQASFSSLTNWVNNPRTMSHEVYAKNVEKASMKRLSFRFELKPEEMEDGRVVQRLVKSGMDTFILPVEEIFDVIHRAHISNNHAKRKTLYKLLSKRYFNVSERTIKIYINICSECTRQPVDKLELSSDSSTLEASKLAGVECTPEKKMQQQEVNSPSSSKQVVRLDPELARRAAMAAADGLAKYINSSPKFATNPLRMPSEMFIQRQPATRRESAASFEGLMSPEKENINWWASGNTSTVFSEFANLPNQPISPGTLKKASYLSNHPNQSIHKSTSPSPSKAEGIEGITINLADYENCTLDTNFLNYFENSRLENTFDRAIEEAIPLDMAIHPKATHAHAKPPSPSGGPQQYLAVLNCKPSCYENRSLETTSDILTCALAELDDIDVDMDEQESSSQPFVWAELVNEPKPAEESVLFTGEDAILAEEELDLTLTPTKNVGENEQEERVDQVAQTVEAGNEDAQANEQVEYLILQNENLRSTPFTP